MTSVARMILDQLVKCERNDLVPPYIRINQAAFEELKRETPFGPRGSRGFVGTVYGVPLYVERV